MTACSRLRRPPTPPREYVRSTCLYSAAAAPRRQDHSAYIPDHGRWSLPTVRFQAGHIPSRCRIVRALCAVAGRCCLPAAAAVAVTVAVSRGGGEGCVDVSRLCAWCQNPIPAKARRDAVCCSVCCRQARRRFLRAVGHADSVAPSRPLRQAYADPRPIRGWPGWTGITRTTAGRLITRRCSPSWPGMTAGLCRPPLRAALVASNLCTVCPEGASSWM